MGRWNPHRQGLLGEGFGGKKGTVCGAVPRSSEALLKEAALFPYWDGNPQLSESSRATGGMVARAARGETQPSLLYIS